MAEKSLHSEFMFLTLSLPSIVMPEPLHLHLKQQHMKLVLSCTPLLSTYKPSIMLIIQVVEEPLPSNMANIQQGMGKENYLTRMT